MFYFFVFVLAIPITNASTLALDYFHRAQEILSRETSERTDVQVIDNNPPSPVGDPEGEPPITPTSLPILEPVISLFMSRITNPTTERSASPVLEARLSPYNSRPETPFSPQNQTRFPQSPIGSAQTALGFYGNSASM